MPKSAKGKAILSGMQEHYGKEKGERVFYATANKQGGKLYQEAHGRPKPKGANPLDSLPHR